MLRWLFKKNKKENDNQIPLLEEMKKPSDNPVSLLPEQVSDQKPSQPSIDAPPSLYGRIQHGWRRLFSGSKPTHPAPEVKLEPAPDIFSLSIEWLDMTQKSLDVQLKNMMHAIIYKKLIKQAKKNKAGNNILVDPDEKYEGVIDHKILYYKRFVNLLLNAKRLIAAAKPVHEIAINTDPSSGMSGKLFVAIKEKANRKINELLMAYSAIYAGINALPFPFLIKTFSSFSQLYKVLSNEVPIDKIKIKEIIHQNPFYKSVKENSGHWLAIIQIAEKHVLQSLKQLLLEMSRKLPVQNPARLLIERTLNDIETLLTRCDRFLAKKPTIRKVLFFIWRNLDLLQSVLSDFRLTYTSLSHLFKNDFLISIEQLNLMFLEIRLTLDRFEVDYFIKPGYLLHKLKLHAVFNEFTLWVNKIGYQFLPEYTYPYMTALINQTVNMQDKYAQDEDRKLMLKDRLQFFNKIMEGKQKKMAKKKRNLYESHARENKEKITEWLNTLIEKLSQSSCCAFLCTTHLRLDIQLLKELKRQLMRNDLDMALANLQIFHDHESINVRKLLFTGEIGEVLKKIRYLLASPADRVHLIEDKIFLLREKAVQLSYWFCQTHKTKAHLVSQITGLTQLKNLLARPGYRLDEALAEINMYHPAQHQVIIHHQVAELEEIRQIEQSLPDFMFGKKIINLASVDLENSIEIIPHR